MLAFVPVGFMLGLLVAVPVSIFSVRESRPLIQSQW
jgi:hypothetical protein